MPESPFVRTDRPSEVETLVYECIHSSARASVWTEIDDATSAHFRPAPSSADSFLLQVEPASDFMKNLESSPCPEVNFAVALEKTTLRFSCRFLDKQGPLLRFQFPTEIFKLQRRKNARFTFARDHAPVAHLSLGSIELSKPIHDLSSSGMSIFVAQHEASYFSDGPEIRSVEFQLSPSAPRISAQGSVSYGTPIADGAEPALYRVGIEFSLISADDEKYLAQFVFEQTARFMPLHY